MTVEAKLEKQLTEWAKTQGGVALKGATTFDTGFPDRLVYLPEASAHVELKGTSTTYHLNAKQKIWAGRIIASKIPYYIIENDAQLEHFKEKVYEHAALTVLSFNMYYLNGFNLTLVVHTTTGTYEVISGRDGSPRRIMTGIMSDSLPNTIYRIFVTLEERFPKTNYCDI